MSRAVLHANPPLKPLIVAFIPRRSQHVGLAAALFLPQGGSPSLIIDFPPIPPCSFSPQFEPPKAPPSVDARKASIVVLFAP